MHYETSYDAGLKPFNPDKSRGRWASPMDFLFACIGHAFKIDAMFALPSLIFRDAGVAALIPYFITMAVCTIPIVFMQTFLGQFSSSGFISVLRIAPIFKGIGYVSLAINIITLTYYSTFAAIPLLYFIHSLRPTLPWSCDGSAHWLEYYENRTTPCDVLNLTVTEDEYFPVEMPSLDFLKSELNIDIISHYTHNGIIANSLSFSWSLILCTFMVWIAVWAVLKNSTEMIGRIIRYSTVAMIAALSICCLRFAFLPGAFVGIEQFFDPLGSRNGLEYSILIPLMALHGLGPGWGSILTMASFNNFKTDITKYTWVLCLGQFGVMMLATFSWIFVEEFLIRANRDQLFLRDSYSLWMQFLSIPTAISFLEMPNFWSLLFFGMMSLGATNLLIVQLLSVLTSVFDEFEQLRERRAEVIRITVGIIALISTLFCSNYGIVIFEFMAKFSVLTQVFLNLMLLLIVLWIYGRERFQRDLHFMTNRTYPTWMVYIVRFVAPIFLLFSFLLGFGLALVESNFSFASFLIIFLITIVPWFLVPGYCIFKIMQTTGFLGRRFRKCVRPTDWYPVDPEDRQRYEEKFSTTDISHQLTTTEDNA